MGEDKGELVEAMGGCEFWWNGSGWKAVKVMEEYRYFRVGVRNFRMMRGDGVA